MTQPWFEPNLFGALYGGIAGGGGGALIGIFGGLIGSVLAPRAIGRRWVLGGMGFVVLLGLAQLGFGLYALLAGQPYGIWFPPTLCGVIYAAVVGSLIPVIRRCYAEAEARRMDAEAIRHS
jgi:hypothetical protein